jgi:hypothetical protein
VFSGHAGIDVLLDGPHVIRLLMLRRNGSDVLRNCNGRVQRTLSGMQPCQCPPTLKGRWEIAKAGAGCEPVVQVAVRLAADPTLGHFLLSSATWVFADHAIALKGALNRRIDMPVRPAYWSITLCTPPRAARPLPSPDRPLRCSRRHSADSQYDGQGSGVFT